MQTEQKENVRYVYREDVQTTQSTGKKWKAYQFIGVTIMTIAAFFIFMGIGLESETMTGSGILGFFLGTPFYLAGRIGGWWHHG